MNFDFVLGAREDAIVAANQVERVGGNFVKEPGAYVGIVETAVMKYFNKDKKDRSGSGGLEIMMKTEEGTQVKVFMMTVKKDGTSVCKPNAKGESLPLPGINQIRGSLMPVLRMGELKAVDNGDEIIYPSIIGKKLGMMIDIRKTLGTTGGKPDPKKVYDNASLKTFFCPTTMLCGSEILEKKTTPERYEKILPTLKVIYETTIVETAGGSNPADPFSDAGTVGGVDDPFATAPTTPAAVVTAPVETAVVQQPAVVAPVVETAPAVQTPAASGPDTAADFWK